MNINVEIFKRYSPKKKIEIINKLTPAELSMVEYATLVRVVKEAGYGRDKSRSKDLNIHPDRRKGNNWDSLVERLSWCNGKLYVDVYFQYENTDTTVCVIAQEFFSRGEYKGRVKRLNHHCDEQTYYFNYSEEEKREVMRSILLEYVYKNYKDKLSEGEE